MTATAKTITTSYGITILPEAVAARRRLFAKADRDMERRMEEEAITPAPEIKHDSHLLLSLVLSGVALDEDQARAILEQKAKG